MTFKTKIRILFMVIILVISCLVLVMCDNDEDEGPGPGTPTATATPVGSPTPNPTPEETPGSQCEIIISLSQLATNTDRDEILSLWYNSKKICTSVYGEECKVNVMLTEGLHDFEVYIDKEDFGPKESNFYISIHGWKNDYCFTRSVHGDDGYVFTIDVRHDCVIYVRDIQDEC